jgi:hypothetical protein
LLDKSGGCGTRTIRCASTCSDSPRRNPLTCLRYSVVEQGYPKAKIKSGFELEVRVWASPHVFVMVLVCAARTLILTLLVLLMLTYLPLCTAEKNHNHAVRLGDNTARSDLLRRRLTFRLCRSHDCLSTWLRSRSCEFRSPA